MLSKREGAGAGACRVVQCGSQITDRGDERDGKGVKSREYRQELGTQRNVQTP